MSRALPIHLGGDADDAARQGAELIASELTNAIAQRGRATIAFSGGSTPWPMVRALAASKVAWDKVDVFQVDERVAPAGDPDRNATQIQSNLIGRASIAKRNWHPIPVEEPDPAGAARDYERTLRDIAGDALDVVHLGLGPDGHTASLVPGDPVLGETERLVAATGPYQGHRRVTLTYPALDAARRIVWFETGAAKSEILRRLVAGDPTIPAGRVLQDRAVVVCDELAAALLLNAR